jgi:hypothetical protein
MKKETIVSVLFVAGLIPAYSGRCAESEAPWKAAGEHFSIDTIQPQFGWVTDAKTDIARWKPLAQPDMDKQLGDAPELRLVEVAPPPERCWVGHRPYLVPNPDGSSWDMIYPYYNTYGGEQECVIHDFGTGKTRKEYLSGRTGDSVLTRERIDFHMQPSFFAAGKLVFEMYGPVVFVVYDPAEDAFVHGVKPFGNDVINGRCVLGEDGLIYGMGWTKDTSGFVAYRFDPKTYEAKRFEAFGPPNENRRETYRKVVMYGDWIYAAIGAQPWHLVAFNFRTGEGRLLAATEPILGDPSTIGISRMKGGLSGYIRSAASIAEIESFDREEFKFWLHEGEISPRVDDIPPWSESPAETQPGARHVWAREFQVWPRDFVPPSPPPIIPADAGSPDTQGRVELPYRLGDQQEASTLKYEVKMYPGEVRLLTEVNDHVLFATDSGYGQHVFYDLKNCEFQRIGGTISPYSFGVFRDRLYVSGYPGSQIIEYDFTRDLGLKQENPNPRRLGYPASDTHVPLGGTVGGADGRVYNAGTTVERRRVGGGLGWYDTHSGELGGTLLEDHRIFWMTSACDDRYLVLSSKSSEQGQLFVWDTETHEFIHRIDPPLGATRPGPIMEALPGLLIGHTVSAEESPLLYGFDPASGDILWTKPVPSPPVTAFSLVRRQAYSFRRGPDGFIWTFFDRTLVRIDPRSAQVRPVGRLPGNERPAQLAFAQGNVFLAGGSSLRRIELLKAGEQ